MINTEDSSPIPNHMIVRGIQAMMGIVRPI